MNKEKQIWEQPGYDFDPPYPASTPVITHYDLLISKTPDELADFLVSTMTCTACQDMHGGKCPKPKDYKEKKCRDMILDWLKSPVEVDG